MNECLHTLASLRLQAWYRRCVLEKLPANHHAAATRPLQMRKLTGIVGLIDVVNVHNSTLAVNPPRQRRHKGEPSDAQKLNKNLLRNSLIFTNL